MQLAEPRFDHIVVVVPARIARNRTAGLASTVIERHDDGVRRAGSRPARVATLLGATFEVVHDAGMPRVDPRLEGIRRIRGAEGRDPREVEAERIGMRLGESSEFRRREGHSFNHGCSVDHGSRTAHRA